MGSDNGQKGQGLLEPNTPPPVEVIDRPTMRAEPAPADAPLATVATAPQHDILSLPLNVMTTRLAEYTQKRLAFRRWLFNNMELGVHYGVPPGCEPKTDRDGNLVDWQGKVIGRDQWRAKPTLYKAGAELLADLLQLRDAYTIDYRQVADVLDKKAGAAVQAAFVVKCQLFARATGALMGEGNGVFSVGEKKMGANNAVKIAEKRAKVDAVINTLALSDLFSQDLDELEARARPAPPADPAAPHVAPRDQRADGAKGSMANVAADDLKAIGDRAARFKTLFPKKSKADFMAWWKSAAQSPDVRATPDALERIDAALLEIETNSANEGAEA